MPRELPVIQDRRVVPCRGVAKLEKTTEHGRGFGSEKLTGPALPNGNEVHALVTLFQNGAQSVCCELAEEKDGKTNCNAVQFDESPFGPNSMNGLDKKSWSRTHYGADCKFAKPAEVNKK